MNNVVRFAFVRYNTRTNLCSGAVLGGRQVSSRYVM